MRKPILLLVTLLIYGSLLLILPEIAVAQGWESSGPVMIGEHKCDDPADPPCPPGQYCYNFQCEPCPGAGPGVCQQWSGGCSIVDGFEGLQDGCAAGWWCASGGCVNCQPAGYGCGGAGGCCAGLLCDASLNKCVSCDAVSHVQTNPPVADGGGRCEASCGASSECDEQAVGAFVGSGTCNAQCQYVDGDSSEAQCALAGGFWNVGGEVVLTPCCGDDAGENPWYRKCFSGACVDNVADRKCCDAPTDCVFNGNCYSDVSHAMLLVVSPTANCLGLSTKAACESGAAKKECVWNAVLSKCTVTRAGVQAYGAGNLSAYADVDSDGSQEVCVASSPGLWMETSGTITGTVRNITDPQAGALVRVLGAGLSATTAADGSYSINGIPSKSHDLVASKSGYEASTSYGVFVPDGATVTVDFTLVRALGGCEDDCTTPGSNVCDASCHGKGLCWFDSDATKAACDGTFGLTELPGGQYVDCCMGRAYTPIKAVVSVPAENVIVTKRPVLYKGKFVNMVIVMFNKLAK